jgi:nucleoside-diphosphate-sugar epimerase
VTSGEAGIANHYGGVHAVVLGASGFIGRWTARALASRGAIVHPVVRNRAPAEPILAEYEVTEEPEVIDLGDAAAVRSMLVRLKPAIVFNLAGYGVDRGERDARMMAALNTELVIGVCDVLREIAARGWPGQRLVHAGSALEYGLARGPLHEDATGDVTTEYGRSKRAATTYIETSCAASGLRAVTARLFTVYGPGEHEGRLLPSLRDAARRQVPLDLTNGEQQRDFTYVEDVAEGLLRLGVTVVPPGAVVNLATGRLTSVRTFTETAAPILGLPHASLRYGALPVRADEMYHDPVPIERLQRFTAWIPSTAIRDGIQRAEDFHRAHCHV